MRTFFNLTLLLFFFNSCTSQTLNTQFVNSISTSVEKSVNTNNKTIGKISITYPVNLAAQLQKVIDSYILLDSKLVPCDGIDAKIQIRYEIKYNSENILSILKVVDYVFCDDLDYTEWHPFVLYVANGVVYNVLITENLAIKTSVDNFIQTSKSSESQCDYTIEDINKYMVIEKKLVRLLLVQDTQFCYGKINLNLQADMIKLEIIK